MLKHKTHHYAKSDENQEEIGCYMSTPVLSVDSQATVLSVTEMKGKKDVGSMLVKENGKYVGIITERDLTRKVLAKKLDPQVTKVSEVMSQPIISLPGDRPVTEANQFMAEQRIRHLAITEKGDIVGMLSVRDLVSFFANPRLRH